MYPTYTVRQLRPGLVTTVARGNIIYLVTVATARAVSGAYSLLSTHRYFGERIINTVWVSMGILSYCTAAN